MSEVKKERDSVDDWMVSPVISLPPDRPVMEAISIMEQKHIGSLIISRQVKNLVTTGEAIEGILTDTDIVRKVIAQGKDPKKIPISSVATPKPYCLETHTSILQASQIMVSKTIKRIPILKEGTVVGVITLTDIMKALVQQGKIYEISELVKYIAKRKIGTKRLDVVVQAQQWMNVNVITCSPKATMLEAAKLMQQYKIGSLIVMDTTDTILGIVTDTDMVKQLAQPDTQPASKTVDSYMIQPVITIRPDDSLISAADLMFKRSIRRLPVVQDGKLHGLLGVTDVVDALLQLNSFAHAHRILEILYEN